MMTTSSAVPLLLFRVLANERGAPAGLLIEPGPGDPAHVLPCLGGQSFAGLAGKLGRYYRPGLDPLLAGALDAAGWQALAADALLRADAPLDAQPLPKGELLIDGEWYMAPPPKLSGAQAASRALSLQLAQLVAADAPTSDIEALLRKDPTLSYHLLRLVNSLGMGVGRRITSFSQAILILGRQQLRRWVNLMLFAARQGDLRSGMLLARVAVRARLLEQLARAHGQDKQGQDQAFITGMFSLLGVLFGMPLPEVLAPLSMSETVHDALIGNQGALGTMLQLCAAYEQGDAAVVSACLAALQIDAAQFNEAAVQATQWMLSAIDGAGAPAHG
ncbi:HDOD domain-containing protein [Massilia sp. PAMC28688]|uniref:EAL and HDOD domain-containing protein n=1 Tax=Massilia sp. PAMC28688 TaxID=2861283 RepID=UPI001C6350D2|nr:HDOD domain-containing protein [Massilia sp. PAMC28688]QYF92424.1 HDOD domain-containing protein [Massilia sp. PAMC28688]